VVVAGDLFDSPSPDRGVVSKGCAAIGRLGVPVYVIPGNHDHGGPGGPWEQPFFRQEHDALAPNLHVLLTPMPVAVGSAVLFPCPLLRRHESEDLTAWLRHPGDLLTAFAHNARIILAHGSIQGFVGTAGDDDGAAVNQLDLLALDPAHWDYVALGDWHGCKEISQNAWYSGTPEPDRFPRGIDYRAGQVLVVTAERGRPPVVKPVATGGIAWHVLEHHFQTDEDLSLLEAEYAHRIADRVGKDAVRLEVAGALGIQALDRLESLLATWQSRLLRCDRRGHVALSATEADIILLTERTGDPLTARIATLLHERLDDPARRDVAEVALRELHLAIAAER